MSMRGQQAQGKGSLARLVQGGEGGQDKPGPRSAPQASALCSEEQLAPTMAVRALPLVVALTTRAQAAWAATVVAAMAGCAPRDPATTMQE